MNLIKDIIQKKRDGEALEAAEINRFIAGVSDHGVSDAQIAAFAMATWFRGMSAEEQMSLTLAMRDSGDVLTWPGLDGPVLDKHSTGGVGDLVSLVLGPLVAACGGYVPMISGRGLGHTGGTLDKLESIPGFDTSPGIGRFQALVRDNRVAIIGQTGRLAPADGRIYAVRDVTGTVSSMPLIISSILSKKLAEGLDALVMDIKYGGGAVTPAAEEAEQLARRITGVARLAGLPCDALITDMDQPLARSAGNALEVMEAVAILRGDERPERLLEVVLALTAELLHLGGLAQNRDLARQMALQALESGRAAERFARMVASQGGPADLLERPASHFPETDFVRAVPPPEAGFLQSIDTRKIGNLVVALGGGRHRVEDRIDTRVGLSDIRFVGEAVDGQQPLAVVHATCEEAWAKAAAVLQSAVRVASRPVEPNPAVLRRIEGRKGHD